VLVAECRRQASCACGRNDRRTISPFATLDIFTERRFTGSPLGVVFDADSLDGVTMQAMAREFE
jgi:hypothetical protein